MDVDIPVTAVPTEPSPVEKLPFELLASIFIMLSHETRSHLDRNSAPWTVTKVCSKWRHVCINSPKAWSILNLTDEIRNIRNAPALLHVFLDRSQSSNLHVSVHFYSRGCEHIFQKLWKSRSRWESATIRESYYTDQVWRVQGVAAEMRTLRSLELDIAHIGPIFKILVNAPLLQRLILSPVLGTSFPFDTLQSLHCRPADAAAFFKVLQEAKCLTECSIDSNENLQGSSPYSEVTHSSIRRLSTTYALTAFNRVTLSNLEDLSVVYGRGGKAGLSPLVGLVSRSHKPLKRLELKFSFKLEEFLPLLKASPSLTALILYRVPLSEVHSILTALTLRDTSTVVPLLTDLTIDFHGDGTGFLGRRLLRMIHSRIEKLDAFRLMLRSNLVVEVLGTRMLASLTKQKMQSEWKELCCNILRRERRLRS
ncbi:hypothetical protein IW262DRAFT_1326488 [Armillaria fumosa]|nr:hypothetical protein IW262DRAFT_1326488 [Armillaria fumosa]